MKKYLKVVCFIMAASMLLSGCSWGRGSLFADELTQEEMNGEIQEDVLVGPDDGNETEEQDNIEELEDTSEAVSEVQGGIQDSEPVEDTEDSEDIEYIEGSEEDVEEFFNSNDVSENQTESVPSEIKDDIDVTSSFVDTRFADKIREVLGIEFREPIMKSQCESVTDLYITVTMWDYLLDGKFTRLDGIENFPNLKSLTIKGFELDNKKFNLETYPTLGNLESLRLLSLGLKEIDLNGFYNLEVLDVSENNLSKLDVGYCGSLKTLMANNNPELSSIGNPSLPSLTSLSLRDCFFVKLNLSGLPNLQYIDLEGNLIEFLVLGNKPDLWYLVLSGNTFDSIDLSRYKKLRYLDISNNWLSRLDIGGLNDLASVYAFNGCYLKELVVDNVNLQYLDCSDCKLKSIDLSKLPMLKTLKCNDNYLKEIKGNGRIEELDCRRNCIQSLRNIKNVKASGNSLKCSPQKEILKNKARIAENLSLCVGGKGKAEILYKPSGSSVKYQSRNKNIATVDKKGRVTAKRPGTATIEVNIDGGYRCKPKVLTYKVKVFKEKLKPLGDVKAIRKGNKIRVSWGKNSNVSGYEVEFARTNKFVYSDSYTDIIEVEKGKSGYSYSCKRKMYVRVRYYVKEDGYYHYSKWSKVIKVNKK